MTHPNEESWRAAVTEELRRITTLDDTIAGTLNNILVGGSVGLIFASVTFLKEIAGARPAAGSLWYLRTSWIVLVCTAAASIISLITSRQAGTLHRGVLVAQVKGEAQRETELTRRCNRWNRATNVFHWAGLMGLTVGTALMVKFAMLNLPLEAKPMAEKKGTEKQIQEVRRDPPRRTPDERPRPVPERKEDKSYDHDTSNPFLQRPPTTPPATDKPEKQR